MYALHLIRTYVCIYPPHLRPRKTGSTCCARLNKTHRSRALVGTHTVSTPHTILHIRYVNPVAPLMGNSSPHPRPLERAVPLMGNSAPWHGPRCYAKKKKCNNLNPQTALRQTPNPKSMRATLKWPPPPSNPDQQPVAGIPIIIKTPKCTKSSKRVG